MKILPITPEDLQDLGIHANEGIQKLRDPLLIAYDSYKASVSYGEINESPSERIAIMTWAQKVRDKEIDALKNIPEKVKYYLHKTRR